MLESHAVALQLKSQSESLDAGLPVRRRQFSQAVIPTSRGGPGLTHLEGQLSFAGILAAAPGP